MKNLTLFLFLYLINYSHKQKIIRLQNIRAINRILCYFFLSSHRAIDAHATASIFPTDIHGHSPVGHFLVIYAGRCVAVAIAYLAVKALASCAGPPRDLIVHGAAFFASFAARVALALTFLMLRDNEKSRLSDAAKRPMFLDYVYPRQVVSRIRAIYCS